MNEAFPTVVPGTPVQDVVDDHMLGEGERAVVVAQGDTVLGIVTVNDVRRTPRPAWRQTPAQAIMTPRASVITVDAASSAIDVLAIIGEKRLNQVPVLEDGRMVGLITRRDVLDRVQLAETLGPDKSPGTGSASSGS